jgi:hypothetical protein
VIIMAISWLSWGIVTLLLPTLEGLSNNRHVCFFSDYSSVKGPHFNGLFDQIVEQSGFTEKRIALLTIGDTYEPMDQELLSNNLGLDNLETFRLDRLNPSELENKFTKFNPTVFWVADCGSALQLRYYMRTSGFDGLVEELCGSFDEKSRLYVGEGAGAICGGSSMALARGQDPAPEPQFRGLDLLGPSLSVSFESNSAIDDMAKSVGEKQVYVWSQQDGEATSFVMSPAQKGAIEGLSNPDPLPPLQEANLGGRRCTGEPSIDPSRMLQMRGDSEWFEGEA